MDTVYTQVSNGVVPKDAQTLDKINDFLEKYPSTISPDKKLSTPWIQLSLHELYRRSIQTAIDIINDVSDVMSNKSTMSNAGFRRRIFAIFADRDRRLYVGFWLIFFSFILYFIDSAA